MNEARPATGPAGWSIRTHLLALGLASIIPALAFAGLLFAQYERSERVRLQNGVTAMATNVAADVDREFEGMNATLEALATSPALSSGDMQVFADQARRSLAGVGATLVVWNAAGERILDSAEASPQPRSPPPVPPAAEQGNAERVGRQRVSNLMVRPVVREPSVILSVPATGPGGSALILGVQIKATRFLEVISDNDLPPGWAVAVTDRLGVVVARTIDHDLYVGKAMPPPVFADAGGLAITRDIEGRRVVGAGARSRQAGWMVYTAVPMRTVEQELRHSVLLFAAVGIGLIALSLALATFFGRRLARPVRELARKASAMAAGGPVAALASGVKEVDDVARVLACTSAGLTERTQALRRAVLELEGLYESAPIGIAMCDRDARVHRINGWLAAVNGATVADHVGRILWDVAPRLTPLAKPLFDAVIARGVPVSGVELSGESPASPGRTRSFLVSYYPVRNPDGEVAAVGMLVEEITDRKQREDEQRYLMRELTHRTKNLLSVVQAMALQTARTSPDLREFNDRFASRLQSLAGSHDLLVMQNWAGASMADLVRSQLGHYADVIGSRILLDGPPVFLSPEAVQNIGMALHELSTNAAKHGALSNEEGKVTISWSLAREADGTRMFRIAWVESGGPVVEPPRRRGFGSTVVTRVVARALDGTVDLQFPQDGLRWTFACPAESSGMIRVAPA